MTLSDRKYLGDHNLDAFYTEISQILLEDKPTNPYDIIHDVVEKFRQHPHLSQAKSQMLSG